MSEKTKLWIKGGVAAIITGASTTLLSTLGISGAEAVGVSVMQLNIRQVGIVTACGGIVGLCAYLKASPVPTE